MKSRTSHLFLSIACLCVAQAASALNVKAVKGDLSKLPLNDSLWKDSPVASVELIAQPMTPPRPKETTTASLDVQAIQDGKWIAFKMSWADTEMSEGGRLGKYSDGVAIEFPAKDGELPSIMMGNKDNPVHIIHWKAQFQVDREQGQKRVKDHYPNMAVDMYPMEYKNGGKLPNFTQDQKDTYSHGRAAGNAQSSPKMNAVDEILAEGFGTSQVVDKHDAVGEGRWEKGRWTVVIVRPLQESGASTLATDKPGNMGFAVWQGGRDEVGSRKSLTMNWEPLNWTEAK